MSNKPAVKCQVPSTNPPLISLKGGTRKQASQIEQSHDTMRQILVRVQAWAAVHAGENELQKKFFEDYMPEIVAAISQAKWAGGHR